eukprot:CAMPEP_0179318028 /NCGR_PEP_ID=MMETSP0797-20121207/56636_1 /TAXON_ID=47934 /ORGANISM="Dinophysis acuminata, Strain DAEP01" /LENGTH=85 /DNA_ID=CAMNT_0021029111 /DNA_START=51 /DNA_END=304 /DNA_ORIENTATION=+
MSPLATPNSFEMAAAASGKAKNQASEQRKKRVQKGENGRVKRVGGSSARDPDPGGASQARLSPRPPRPLALALGRHGERGCVPQP